MSKKGKILLPVFTNKKKIQKLSFRELEVINTLSIGLTYNQVAIKLGITSETVKRHCLNMRKKTGLKTTLAIAVAVTRKQVEEQYRNLILCSD